MKPTLEQVGQIMDMNIYQKYALEEFRVLGWPGDCEMQKLICDCLVELLGVYGGRGHSGTSAPYTVNLFERLALFKPISLLTGQESEWGEPFDEEGTQQNKRMPEVFKNKDGAYWIGHPTKPRVPVQFPWGYPDDCF